MKNITMTTFFDRQTWINQTILDENVNEVENVWIQNTFLKLSIHTLADTVENDLILIWSLSRDLLQESWENLGPDFLAPFHKCGIGQPV